MTNNVDYSLVGGIARIAIDDGKNNVMSIGLLQSLHECLDRAEGEADVVLLLGRPGMFSAGFDLQVFARRDPEEVRTMMVLGAELALRTLEFPRPVVAGCTGHAYPMGAFLLLASDYVVGAAGQFRIGLNEVAIGLTLPRFAVELARATLAPHFFNRLVTGEMLDPALAREAGYLDQLAPSDQLEASAMVVAEGLTRIDRKAHRETKARIRGAAAATVRRAIDDELTIERFSRVATDT